MALLKYFKRDDSKPVLPSADGLLSSIMPCSRIQSANKSVEPLLSEEESGSCGQ